MDDIIDSSFQSTFWKCLRLTIKILLKFLKYINNILILPAFFEGLGGLGEEVILIFNSKFV